MKYNGFEVDDKKIDEYVDKLGCSIAEACDLILEDSGKKEESTETRKAIAESEKNAPRRYEKSKERKKMERVRKVDEEKGFLLGCVKTLVESLKATEVTMKNEVELTFNYNGNRYTFKLTKHRPPKQAVYVM